MNVAAFLACSLDGCIAEPDGGLDWLVSPPPGTLPDPLPDSADTGYDAFLAGRDAIVMGRGTYDVVAGFDPWPYPLPVRVLTHRPLLAPPPGADVAAVSGTPAQVVEQLAAHGHHRLYVDGGAVVTSFLDAGLLDEITITWVPVVLGAGIRLFGPVAGHRWLRLTGSREVGGAYLQTTYVPTG